MDCSGVMDWNGVMEDQLDWCVQMLHVLHSTANRTSAWPPDSGATCDPSSSATRGQQQSEGYTSQLKRGRQVPSALPSQHVLARSSWLINCSNMQGSNSAPNFQQCGNETMDLRCSSESAMPHSGYQGMVRSAAPWTQGGSTPKSSPIAVVRPHELQRKNRHWSVVPPITRGSLRQQPFEPLGLDGSPHSRHSECYTSTDSMMTHSTSSLHSKHSSNYDQSILTQPHQTLGASLHTGDIPYSGQFAPSDTAPSPPLPPVRDSSSLKYTRIGQTHEKYPSWPVTAANQAQDDTTSVCSSSRTNSWSEPTTTTSSGEFPMKPNKMVYQPRLRHIDEKVTSDSLRRHLEENGVKSHKQFATGQVLEAVAAHMTSDSQLKNFHTERSFPRYDHEGILRDNKDYTVPSPPERDVTVFTATSCDLPCQWSRDTHTSASWDSSCHPNYSASVQSCEDDRATIPPDSTPTHRVTTRLRSATDTFNQVASLTSPTSLPPEILSSRNVSVKYVVRSSKPYYNTGTQTEDTDTGDVVSHDLKSSMSQTVAIQSPRSTSDIPPKKGMKEASTSPSPKGRVESFCDNAPITDDPTRQMHSLKDSGQQTVIAHTPLGVTARNTTLTTPMHYTAPSAIGATARTTFLHTHSPSLSGATGTHNTSVEHTSLPSSSLCDTFQPSIHAVKNPTSKDSGGVTSQWSQVSPQIDTTQQLSPLHDDLLAQIHEHSPSQTQMLRKLSQEFYGVRLQQHSNFTFAQPRKVESLSSLPDTHEVLAPTSQSFMNEVPDASSTVRNDSSATEAEPRSWEWTEPEPKSWERMQNMSLRKAYGTCDDHNRPVSERFHKAMHGRSVSTSHMLKQKTSPPPTTGHKGQSSLDSSSKITRRVKDFVGSLWGGTKSSVDTQKIAEEARRDWEQRGMPRKVGAPSKLKRTTSEQIRPMKDQTKERPRMKDIYSGRSGECDPASSSYRKTSDQHRFHSAATKHTHRSSDPMETAPPHNNDTLKHISADSDVFVDSPEQQVSLRPGSTRSTTSSGSMEDRHSSSDPQLKKFQQRAVLSFFEVKTGKRTSNSSIDSTGGGNVESWQVAPHVDDESRKEAMKKSLPHDVLQVCHRHGRASSGSYQVLRDAEKMFPAADTSFGDDSLSPPLLDIPAGDRSVLSLSPVSSVSSPTTQEYSPPLHPWGNDLEYRTTVQQRKSEADRNPDDFSDNLTERIDPETHPKTRLDPETHPKTRLDPETHPKTRLDPETQHKITYEYSSSSGSNSSPVKSANELSQKFTYHMTVRQSYSAEEDAEESPPPTLPPRNYRQKHDTSCRGDPHHSLPPPPPGGDAVKNERGGWSGDYDSTPKADSYANQVRQQAYRLSQSHSSLLGPGRHPSKLSPDVKTGVSTSRPVDKPPTAQEALAPQPRSRAETEPSVCQSDNYSDSFRLEMNIAAAAASCSSAAISTPDGASRMSPVPSSSGSVFVDDKPLLALLPTGCFDRTDARQLDNEEQPVQPDNSYHRESFQFRTSSSGSQPGQVKHDLSDDTSNVCVVSATMLMQDDVDHSLIRPDSHAEPPWMSGHKVVNPSHRVRSMSPERGALSESERDMEERLSVHALLSNFEKKSSASSSLRGTVSTDVPDTLPRMTLSAENLSPVMHPKVSQIRETFVRKSNENLLQLEYQDNSLRISPGTPPQQRRESTGNLAMASMPHRQHSPRSTPKPWHETGVSDVRAFTHTYKSIGSADPLSEVTMATTSSQNSATTAGLKNVVAQKSNESLNSSLGDSDALGRSPDIEVTSISEHTNSQTLSGDRSPAIVPHHRRHKSQEEQECEKQAAVLVQQLSQLDKHLCDIILPSPELKMTTDYMTGIFDTSVDVTRRPSILMRNNTRPELRQQSSERSSDVQDIWNTSQSPLPASSPYWSPPSVAHLQNKIREEGHKIDDLLKDVGDADTSLHDQKAELMGRIKKKLEILVEEKRLLDEEIAENVRLGDELTSVVTEKVENKAEFAKYQLYVTELGKVMKLLLQLSGRLARANNAINTLAEGGENKEKGALIQKRDELSEKHEDAKQLKEGIDRRSHQVAAFLRRHLLADEFVDYEHFIKMKCKLMIEQQEIDDKIKLGREQLAALQQSIAESSA